MSLLDIRNLHVSIGDTPILRGVDLQINLGEVHAIMGPNGSGKSTLANVIAGRPEYSITDGEVIYKGSSLTNSTPEERALEGIFLAFQYPVELPGVRNWQFLKSAVDALRKHRGEDELGVRKFDKLFNEKVAEVGIDQKLVKRSVNEGFSGGEKKRNEILQMSLLDPTLAIMDETDSGLDIDALKLVADGVNRHRGEQNSIVLVTHYQRILNYIAPDFVHVLIDGKIEISGGNELADKLEAKGYEWVRQHSEERNR